jgi:hypothetical protein
VLIHVLSVESDGSDSYRFSCSCLPPTENTSSTTTESETNTEQVSESNVSETIEPSVTVENE